MVPLSLVISTSSHTCIWECRKRLSLLCEWTSMSTRGIHCFINLFQGWFKWMLELDKFNRMPGIAKFVIVASPDFWSGWTQGYPLDRRGMAHAAVFGYQSCDGWCGSVYFSSILVTTRHHYWCSTGWSLVDLTSREIKKLVFDRRLGYRCTYLTRGLHYDRNHSLRNVKHFEWLFFWN